MDIRTDLRRLCDLTRRAKDVVDVEIGRWPGKEQGTKTDPHPVSSLEGYIVTSAATLRQAVLISRGLPPLRIVPPQFLQALDNPVEVHGQYEHT
eukprot:scaffold2254_cov393-Prasinococcus_capsulatus_cf.AAC.13